MIRCLAIEIILYSLNLLSQDYYNLIQRKFSAARNMSKASNIELTLNQEDQSGNDGLVVEHVKPKLRPPPMYRVVLYNDDYTPMEFVVQVLEVFFNMKREQATQVMLTVHSQGKAVCGTYTRDIAETKVVQVNRFSSDNEHPLLCGIDSAD